MSLSRDKPSSEFSDTQLRGLLKMSGEPMYCPNFGVKELGFFTGFTIDSYSAPLDAFIMLSRVRSGVLGAASPYR
jgi:hypothetical protein